MGLGKGEGSDGAATLTKSSTIYAFSQTSQPRVMRGWFSPAPLVEFPFKFLSLSLSLLCCLLCFVLVFCSSALTLQGVIAMKKLPQTGATFSIRMNSNAVATSACAV